MYWFIWKGEKEELLHYRGNEPVRGDKEETVVFLAVSDLLNTKPELRDKADRVKVKIRPFS